MVVPKMSTFIDPPNLMSISKLSHIDPQHKFAKFGKYIIMNDFFKWIIHVQDACIFHGFQRTLEIEHINSLPHRCHH